MNLVKVTTKKVVRKLRKKNFCGSWGGGRLRRHSVKNFAN